jgi:putative tricarboxylic transport membrane protein
VAARAGVAARAAASATLLVSAAYLWRAWQLPAGTFAAPGAGFFPLAVGGFLVIVATVLVAAAFRGWAPDAASASAEPEPPAPGAGRRVLVTSAGLAGFCVLLPWAGYFVTAWLLVTVLLRRLGDAAWWRATLAGLVIAVVSHYLFAVLLGVALPRGLLVP